MSEEKVHETLKIYLFYGINAKDKVNGQQSNAIFIFVFIFLFLFFLCIYLFILNFFMYTDLMTKPLLVPPNGFIKTI